MTKTKQAKTGRPSKYTQEIADEICARIALGETVSVICKDAGMPAERTVWDWTEHNALFSQAFARARIAQTRTWADQIVTIADSVQEDYLRDADGNPVLNSKEEPIFIRERPQRTHQRIEVRKWLMTKINVAEYGEKIAHNVHHSYEGREDEEILAEVQAALADAGITPEEVIGWLKGPVQ